MYTFEFFFQFILHLAFWCIYKLSSNINPVYKHPTAILKWKTHSMGGGGVHLVMLQTFYNHRFLFVCLGSCSWHCRWSVWENLHYVGSNFASGFVGTVCEAMMCSSATIVKKYCWNICITDSYWLLFRWSILIYILKR